MIYYSEIQQPRINKKNISFIFIKTQRSGLVKKNNIIRECKNSIENLI